jgi:signal transduction histidine kinase
MKAHISLVAVVCLWVLTLALCVLTVALTGFSQPYGEPSAHEVLPFVPEVMAFCTAGGLVAWRRPSMPAGWLLIGVGLIWTLVGVLHAYVVRALATGTSGQRVVVLAAWLSNWIWVLAFAALGFFFLLFPNGRLPGPRWRIVAWGAVAGFGLTIVGLAFTPGPLAEAPTIVNPFGIDGGEELLKPANVFGPPTLLAMTASPLVRFRGADWVQRRQLLWMVLAGAVFLAVDTSADILNRLDPAIEVGGLHIAAFGGVPVAAAIAILRHRLFDIERVVSRTIVYGLLGVFVTAAYAAVVLGLGAALGIQSSLDLPLSIVATALVAVAFQPVREWTQRFVNRVVYGRRATPYEVLAAFSRRWGEPLANEAFLPELARALGEGTGAIQAAVWLSVGGELKAAAVWPAQPAEPEPPRLTNGQLPPGAVPVRHQGQVLGALTVVMPSDEALTTADNTLLSDLAAQAALAIRNLRLIEELKASRQRIVAAQDAERRRLERDIHDGAQQRLVSLSLALRIARARPGVTPQLAVALDESVRYLSDGLAEMRELARGVHPAVLTDAGLGPALIGLAERSPIVTRLESLPGARLPSSVEATAYQIASHALAVAADAGAMTASLKAEYDKGRLVVEVRDDAPYSTELTRQTSLPGLDDRVAALDGILEVEACAGQGRVVRAVIPCESS